MNKVILIGYVGQDAELTTTTNGNKVAKFSVATSESYKDKQGNKVQNTEWHNIVVWGTLAEIADKLAKKSKQVAIEGKIQTSTWDDKDGNKRYKTEILADKIQILGKREDGEYTVSEESAESAPAKTSAPAQAAKAPAKATTPAGKTSVAEPAYSGFPSSSDTDDDLPF